MLTDRLRKVVDALAALPDDAQDAYAAWLELDLEPDENERQRIAAQLADPKETDLDYLLQRADEQSSRGEVYDLDTIL
jgi:hypothetical protein